MNKFQVGDVLRVREWDDMAAEFGVYANGSIRCEATFTRLMKKYCGEIFTVRDRVGNKYYPAETKFNGWIFTADMLEYADTTPYSERKIKAATRQQLNKLYGR